MKIREYFVSNSSSSSFIIKKNDISQKQLDQIKNHIQYYKENLMKEDSYGQIYMKEYINEIENDAWEITDTENTIKGCTVMTNFDMNLFFNKIGVTEYSIEWGDY